MKSCHNGIFSTARVLSATACPPRPGKPATTLGEGHSLASSRHYLEGLELTLHLLGEVLAVLTELALPGGLGDRVLQPRFQLQEERPRLTGTESAPRRGPSASAVPRASEASPPRQTSSPGLRNTLET